MHEVPGPRSSARRQSQGRSHHEEPWFKSSLLESFIPAAVLVLTAPRTTDFSDPGRNNAHRQGLHTPPEFSG